MAPLLAPRSVAVVGAGRSPGGIGHETLRAIVEYGFTGALSAVNPHAETVAGVPAYPSLLDVPGPVDLAVIAVPAVAVAATLADAGRAGVRAAVILSSGFGEEGEAGRTAQADLVRLARTHGIRIVGPNCIGVLNTDPAVRLAAMFAPMTPPPGGLAVASQSGAVGVAVLDHAARTGCGVSTFVSLGNKADVSGNDLIAYWFDDPATTAVALYLESFGNPRKFARVVRALARRKPVLAVKSGRSIAGQRAGASHTAAAAAPDVAVDALFAQAGVVRTDNLGELLDAARMLTDQPLPAGNRVAILGNAGGVNVLAADAAEPAGLVVPDLRGLRQPVRPRCRRDAGWIRRIARPGRRHRRHRRRPRRGRRDPGQRCSSDPRRPRPRHRRTAGPSRRRRRSGSTGSAGHRRCPPSAGVRPAGARHPSDGARGPICRLAPRAPWLAPGVVECGRRCRTDGGARRP